MNIDFDLNDVLNVNGKMPSAYVHLSDWFSFTWHCSHIRFISVNTWKNFDLSIFLAWVFDKDPSHPQLDISEWLPNCKLVEIEKEQIEKWISHAKTDYDEESIQERSNVEGTQFPIPSSATNNVKWGFEIRGEQDPGNKHLAGPTYILFWQNAEWLHYLEIHNES